MNAITRWDPFKELDELQSRLSTMFGRAPVRKDGGRDEAMTVAEWAPLVDIVEDDHEYLIKAEVPEVKKEDVKVTVQNGVLSLMGDRKFTKEEKDKKYHQWSAHTGVLCEASVFRKMRMKIKSAQTSKTEFCRFICRNLRRHGPRISK